MTNVSSGVPTATFVNTHASGAPVGYPAATDKITFKNVGVHNVSSVFAEVGNNTYPNTNETAEVHFEDVNMSLNGGGGPPVAYIGIQFYGGGNAKDFRVQNAVTSGVEYGVDEYPSSGPLTILGTNEISGTLANFHLGGSGVFTIPGNESENSRARFLVGGASGAIINLIGNDWEGSAPTESGVLTDCIIATAGGTHLNMMGNSFANTRTSSSVAKICQSMYSQPQSSIFSMGSTYWNGDTWAPFWDPSYTNGGWMLPVNLNNQPPNVTSIGDFSSNWSGGTSTPTLNNYISLGALAQKNGYASAAASTNGLVNCVNNVPCVSARKAGNNGDLGLLSTDSSNVEHAGTGAAGMKVDSAFKITDQGKCTMSRGACSAQNLSQIYAAAPVCFAQWTGSGTLTGILKVPSTATQVIPASTVNTDTAVVNWGCFGN